MQHTMPVHESMSQFGIDGDSLVVGGMPIELLAARVGSTPFYAYDRSVIARGIELLRAALPKKIEIHYAMKANPMPAMVCFMTSLVDGIDVASGGEMKIALDTGISPQNVSFAGPGKRESELRQAVAAGVLLNVESFREIELLARLSNELGRAARVAIRVNPDFELKGSGMKMGGGPKQFGIDAEAVPLALGKVRALELAFEGFHLFAGSQNLNAESICEAQNKSFELAIKLSEHISYPVKLLNLGGGFGIPYFPGERRLDLSPIGENLEKIVEKTQKIFPEAKLALELGRFLVGESGIYVTRVIDQKISRGQRYLITDGGLNHHLSASGNFGQVIRKNYPVAIGNRMSPPCNDPTTIVGPLCTPLDTLADKMLLAEAELDDLVVVFQSGAYGASASPNEFLGHPKVTEVLI